MSQPSVIKLSVCITTFNRAAFIGATLESILNQITNDCEVVILDGASTDDTERVVLEYGRRFERMRYIRQHTNNGLDRCYDRVVELARGEFCWLMTDDDFLRPGAVAAVLNALRWDLSLVIVNEEARDFNMSEVLQHRLRNFESDRRYAPEEMDRLFVEVNGALNCNCVVIRRSIWLEREKERYYGSSFIHMGVIFQKHLPGEALVMAEPFVSWRMGNTHTFWSRMAEFVWVTLPLVVESLAVSDWAKRKVHAVEPWRSIEKLLFYRALGWYSLAEYRRWVRPRLRSIREKLAPMVIALLPGTLVNALFVSYYSVRRHRGVRLQFVRGSCFYFRNWRVFKREMRECRQLS